MSISWGMKERFKFTAGGALNHWSPQPHAGIYSITFKQDSQNKPKAHTVLYFGEAGDFTQESNSINQVLEGWEYRGGSVDELFVFVHPMPGSTRMERLRVQKALVGDYKPHGNNSF